MKFTPDATFGIYPSDLSRALDIYHYFCNSVTDGGGTVAYKQLTKKELHKRLRAMRRAAKD